MSRRLVSILATSGLLATAVAVVPGVVLAGDPCFHEFDNRPAPSSGATSQVVLGDCVFTPTVTRVAVGTTVTWRNASSQEHEVVGANMTWGAHAKLLSPGDTIGWTFDRAGLYGYSCMIHPGMTGIVAVGDAAEAAVAATGVPLAAAASSDVEADGAGPSAAVVGGAAGVGGLAIGLFLAHLRRRDATLAA
jgi:plastocyanin